MCCVAGGDSELHTTDVRCSVMTKHMVTGQTVDRSGSLSQYTNRKGGVIKCPLLALDFSLPWTT